MSKEFRHPDTEDPIRPTGLNKTKVMEAVMLERRHPKEIHPDVVQVGTEIHPDLNDKGREVITFFFYMLENETDKLPAGVTFVRNAVEEGTEAPAWLDTLLSEVSDLTFYNPGQAKSWLYMKAKELASSS